MSNSGADHGSTWNYLEGSYRETRLIQQHSESGKVARLTLTLTIKPIGHDTGQYEIRDQIKTMLPSLDRGMTLMFGTPEWNLQRDDPRQPDLPLRAIPDLPEISMNMENENE